MARTFVKAYEYNDPELIEKIGHLLGSDEWYREHSQHIWRKKLKEIVRPGMKFGTANPYVVRIANKFGFKYVSKRGKYEYFEN